VFLFLFALSAVLIALLNRRLILCISFIVPGHLDQEPFLPFRQRVRTSVVASILLRHALPLSSLASAYIHFPVRPEALGLLSTLYISFRLLHLYTSSYKSENHPSRDLDASTFFPTFLFFTCLRSPHFTSSLMAYICTSLSLSLSWSCIFFPA